MRVAEAVIKERLARIFDSEELELPEGTFP
jgi:hypothetical protein